MIAKLHSELLEKRQALMESAFTQGSLDMDSYVQYILYRGKYAGLSMAIEEIESMLNEPRSRT